MRLVLAALRSWWISIICVAFVSVLWSTSEYLGPSGHSQTTNRFGQKGIVPTVTMPYRSFRSTFGTFRSGTISKRLLGLADTERSDQVMYIILDHM